MHDRTVFMPLPGCSCSARIAFTPHINHADADADEAAAKAVARPGVGVGDRSTHSARSRGGPMWSAREADHPCGRIRAPQQRRGVTGRGQERHRRNRRTNGCSCRLLLARCCGCVGAARPGPLPHYPCAAGRGARSPSIWIEYSINRPGGDGIVRDLVEAGMQLAAKPAASGRGMHALDRPSFVVSLSLTDRSRTAVCRHPRNSRAD